METITKEGKGIDNDLISALDFHNLEEAGLEMLYYKACSKLALYNAENQRFFGKYKMVFEEFSKKMAGKINEEDFQEEDDLMAWQFSFENVKYWEEKVKELKSCL